MKYLFVLKEKERKEKKRKGKERKEKERKGKNKERKEMNKERDVNVRCYKCNSLYYNPCDGDKCKWCMINLPSIKVMVFPKSVREMVEKSVE